MKCRKADIKKYGEEQLPYEVWSYEPNNKVEMTSLVEKLHNDPRNRCGTHRLAGKSESRRARTHLCQFRHYRGTIPLRFGDHSFHRQFPAVSGPTSSGRRRTDEAQLFIIPNLNDNRVGKRSELILWDNTRETFSNYGYVTGKIPRRADMERFSTIAALDMQYRYVSSVFDKIYFSIFDKTGPIREMELSGIQLTENLYPKNGKKKYQAETSTHIALDEDEEQENNSEHQHNQ